MKAHNMGLDPYSSEEEEKDTQVRRGTLVGEQIASAACLYYLAFELWDHRSERRKTDGTERTGEGDLSGGDAATP